MKTSKTLEFIRKAKLKHGEKFDYSESVYLKSNKKIKITCKTHGEFLQAPYGHLASSFGCEKCSYEIRAKRMTGDIGHFISRAESFHGKKYDYSKCEYINDRTKLKIICPNHGSFWQSPNNHYKEGCLTCGTESARIKRHKDSNGFLSNAITTHNNKYNYSVSKYDGSHRKIDIICNIHGLFSQSPANHLKGSGCPWCSASNGELEIKRILDIKNINYIFQYYILDGKRGPKSFDFKIGNTMVEYQGRQHYRPDSWGGEEAFISRQQRDKYKRDWCKKNGHNLLEIKYTDFNKIGEILAKALSIDNSTA